MANPESSLVDFIAILKIFKEKNLIIKVPENLKCQRCKLIVVDAVQTECGCRYCKSCLDKHIEQGSKKCDGDSEDCKVPITRGIPDKATNREISSLSVKCYNEGCQFEGQLKNMYSHLSSCVYRREHCKLCGNLYLEREMTGHQTNQCCMRQVKCDFCKMEFTEKELKNNHLQVESEELCSKYVGPCPYKCDVTDEVNLFRHRSLCTKKPNNCPLHVFGCKLVIAMSGMNEHLHKASYEHLTMIAEEYNQLLKKIEDLKSTIDRVTTENDVMKVQLSTNKRDLESKLTQMDRNPSKYQPSSIQRVDTVFRNGKYIWKINEFSKLKDNAMIGVNISLLSDPFYTSEFGYKMCLKIYPYGDGMGKGTHLSVFFVLMRGEYDSLQVWPFMNKVVLTILENFTKTTNHSDTFKPDARSICYQQPDDEYNIASGSPKFISFTDLNKFLKNDTLFIQIVVPS